MYLFKGKVCVGETMQETAEVEEAFSARNDEEARKIAKDTIAPKHVLVEEHSYKLFQQIPIEVRPFVDSH